jgi:hypothetical protein
MLSNNIELTGNDPLSIIVLDKYKKGFKIKDVVRDTKLNTSQATKLSRFHHMLIDARMNFPLKSFQKFKYMGLKSLGLSPLFQKGDWLGALEVLELISNDTSKAEIERLVLALGEKQKRLEKTVLEVKKKTEELEHKEEKVQKSINKMQSTIRELEKATEFLEKYPPEAKQFLREHLGTKENKLVLAKRLDYQWQRLLRKKEVLAFNDVEYIWEIIDLDSFAEDLCNRLKKGYRVYFDANYLPDKTYVPNRKDYKNVNPLSLPLQDKIKEQETILAQLKEEKRDIGKIVKEIKQTSVISYLEHIEVSEETSKKDMKNMKVHKKLQNLSLRWLYQKGYVACAEVRFGSQQWDVAGFNSDGQVIIIEVKSSLEDFLRDAKWKQYLMHCSEFYLVVPKDLAYEIELKLNNEPTGLLAADNNSLKLMKEASCSPLPTDKSIKKIIFSISRTMAKKIASYNY